LRSTPINHRNAIPAKGTRSSANFTALRRLGSVIHMLGVFRSAGTVYRTSPKLMINRTENITPAIAAPRGAARGREPRDVDLLVTVFGDHSPHSSP
jgi:hypothetical protein